MSRKECKYGNTCCDELCPLDPDLACDVECPDYEFSGIVKKPRRKITLESARLALNANIDRLQVLKRTQVTFYNGRQVLTERKRILKRIVKLTEKIKQLNSAFSR